MSTLPNTPSQKSVAELEAELREARAREAEAKRAARDAVQPVYQFTLTPEEPHQTWQPIFDDTCTLWKLSGKVLNADELKSVGKSPFEGAMKYVHNGATGLFVTSVGGGSIFLKSRAGWLALSDFLVSHPEGGDVTEIVTRYRATEEKF